MFEACGITIPRGITVSRGDDLHTVFTTYPADVQAYVVKSQILSGKRGKHGGIKFCSSLEDVQSAVRALFSQDIRGMYVAKVRVEEKLDIAHEHYLSITYDTSTKQPLLIYSAEGGVDIEDVAPESIRKIPLDIRQKEQDLSGLGESTLIEVAEKLYRCFRDNDARLVEINPLVRTTSGAWVAADAKVALDPDAFYRHKDAWSVFEPRTEMGRPPTEREIAVKKIDDGDGYYRGTAGKYIEMDGDIAILFSGGGASIANMDALLKQGLQPANYTEYSGNPPREKVHALAKIVLSKPGLRGLWIAGGVANFTNVKDTFAGIADALDEVKPTYPIVIRRAGPYEKEGMSLMRACAERNCLNIKLFGKEISMSESAGVLAEMVSDSTPTTVS